MTIRDVYMWEYIYMCVYVCVQILIYADSFLFYAYKLDKINNFVDVIMKACFKLSPTCLAKEAGSFCS